MIKLLTSNPNKYKNFKKELDFLKLNLTITEDNLSEIQTESIKENIIYKAIEAEKKYKEPVFVDDSALFTEQYKSFPGVNTKLILKQLGKQGLEKLFKDENTKAKMVTILGISINGKVFTYIGEVKGSLDFDVEVENPKMLLSDIFTPIDQNKNIFYHRLNALSELKKDIDNLYDYLKDNIHE